MRIHHLNCATMCPLGGRLVTGDPGAGPAKMVCHCLLIELADGLVLVDTALGLEDCRQPLRLGRLFKGVLRPACDPDETAARQVEALGFRREDVRHIVLTHLDLDHAGGLADFPHARVHVLADEHDAATAPTWRERSRYCASHWAHGPDWVLHRPAGEPWLGFPCVRELPGLPPEILLVPLTGHTRGHAGIAVQTPEGWLLHCGDAYFHPCDVHGGRTPAGLLAFQRFMAADDPLRRATLARLRELASSQGDVRLFCAHDPSELDALAQQAAQVA